MPRLLLIALLLVASPALADEATDKLAQQIRSLESELPSKQQASEARESLGKSLRDKLRAANAQSSAEWAKLTTKEEWEAFRSAKLARLRASLHLPQERSPAKVHVSGELPGDGYTVRKIVYESRPQWFVTANLYVPAKPKDKSPGILLSHSHHSPKSQGELQDMGATWARAGCYVLVPDHLGHGERREHPFATSADYGKEYPVGRQDYHFRYDNSLQLNLAGESLMGWLVHDLMAGVDVLLAQPNIDPQKIILLGGVAGGGDPAAVTGAVDERIACVGPFNFGGPQPETRYPLPEDAETWFNYAGDGSWESTRNLAGSAEAGFLPWVIVGSIAPRKLVYGHEFSWDGERDPVWKRLQTIWGWYGDQGGVAVAHGKGNLQGQEPESSHCGNIGAFHRRMIHPLLAKWFDIQVQPEDEFSKRFSAAELSCWTPELRSKLQPRALREILAKQVDVPLQSLGGELAKLSNEQRRSRLDREFDQTLGLGCPRTLRTLGKFLVEKTLQIDAASPGFPEDRYLLTRAEFHQGQGQLLLLYPEGAKDNRPPLVLAIGSGGVRGFVQHRATELAELLRGGFAVCIADVSVLGQLQPGGDRGQNSALAALSASQLMLGRTLVADQVQDLRDLLTTLKENPRVDVAKLFVWGESFARPLAADADFKYPRRVDRPEESDPVGGLLALILAAQEPQTQAVLVRGGLGSYRELLDSPFVQAPYSVILPGLLTRCDLPAAVAALRPLPVRLEGLVDGRNRLLSEERLKKLYQAAIDDYARQYAPNWLTLSVPTTSPARFFSAPHAEALRK